MPWIASNSVDGGSTSTGTTITHGFTLQANDVIIATLNINGTGTVIASNPAFTFEDSTANPDSAIFNVYSRICGASEPSTFNFTFNIQSRYCLVIQQFRGINVTNIWDVRPSSSSRTTGLNQASGTSPNIVAGVEGAIAVAMFGDDNAPTTTTFSSINNGFGNTRSETGQQYSVMANKSGLTVGQGVGATTIFSSANVSYVFYMTTLRPQGVPFPIQVDKMNGIMQTMNGGME